MVLDRFRLKEYEDFIGIRLDRKPVRIEDSLPHDERYSYGLCQRFYGRSDIRKAIAMGNSLLKEGCSVEEAMHLLATVGNLYYIEGEFAIAAGYFMRLLSIQRADITPWIEFLFCLRSMGEFELFERALFNMPAIYKEWQYCPDKNLTQDRFLSILKNT